MNKKHRRQLKIHTKYKTKDPSKTQHKAMLFDQIYHFVSV